MLACVCILCLFFSGRDLLDDILFQFHARLCTLSEPAIPITSKFLLAEYQQDAPQLACPACVWPLVKQQHAKAAAKGALSGNGAGGAVLPLTLQLT